MQILAGGGADVPSGCLRFVWRFKLCRVLQAMVQIEQRWVRVGTRLLISSRTVLVASTSEFCWSLMDQQVVVFVKEYIYIKRILYHQFMPVPCIVGISLQRGRI